jgi:hypothetical protein
MGNSTSVSEKTLTSEEINYMVKEVVDETANINLYKGGKISLPSTDVKLSPEKYIWLMYQAVDNMSIENNKTYPNMIELLFYITSSTNQHCTGTINFYYDSMELGLETSPRFKIKDNNKFTDKFTDFVGEFAKRVRESNCPFTSLSVILSWDNNAHANILLAFKDKDSNKIFLVLYDPHGSKLDSSIRKTSNALLKSIKECDSNFVVLSRKNISCPIGQQSYANDTMGYCVMFSLFWLYCVLKISKKSNYQIDINNIKYIEKSIIRNTSSSRGLTKKPSLWNTILNFSMFLSNEYIGLLSKNPDFYVSYINSFLVHYNYEYEKTLPYLYDDESLTKEEIKSIERTSSGKTKRKVDYEKCKNDNDCLSGNCKKNICVPYVVNKPRQSDKVKLFYK